MNAFGQQCRSLLVVVEGEAIFDVDRTLLAGSHGGCVLPHPPHRVRPALLLQEFSQFCEAAHIPHRSFRQTELCGEILQKDPDYGLESLPPMVLVLCAGVAEVCDLLAAVLRPFPHDKASPRVASRESIFCLLAMVEVGEKTAVGPAVPASTDNLSWLRPPQSYESELQQMRSVKSEGGAWRIEEIKNEENKKERDPEETYTKVPLHMYSNYPILRDCETSCGDLTKGTNLCTLDAILRELAYKAGHLPKYGS
ncbi:unnamed protein product [Phytomonas sp. Hart1]|nr:unnamed protein product [Phytomonas sp. Hart1]|eukprot:CCW69646.1 unnamed protein product [Phytomonas sp. isolate Hart1]